MILQKMPHYVDSILTQEDASAALQDGQVVVGLYTNRENVQSVVHSHPYYEMILPVAGSSVRYSVDGSVYDLHLGELILFPGEMYHSGKFNITDTTSERLVVQIAPGIWERAWAQSGLPRHVWSGDPVILDTDAVTQWDFRGLLERMAQTVYLDEKIRDTVQCCEVTELILLISQVVTRRHNAPPPSATSLLVAKAVAYLQANYTDPHLTVAQLAKYTYTSREHLSRVFKEYTLESIHGYLTNLRMQHCRNELADGTGVLDACTASGFANYSSFLKSFRALYGITAERHKENPTLRRARYFRQISCASQKSAGEPSQIRKGSPAVFIYVVLIYDYTMTFCPPQRYFRRVGTRTLILIGFAIWSFIPASSATCLSSENAFAVMATMGIFAF